MRLCTCSNTWDHSCALLEVGNLVIRLSATVIRGQESVSSVQILYGVGCPFPAFGVACAPVNTHGCLKFMGPKSGWTRTGGPTVMRSVRNLLMSAKPYGNISIGASACVYMWCLLRCSWLKPY